MDESSTSSPPNFPLLIPQGCQIFQPGWRQELTNDQYHADKSAVSSTILKTALKSPATFYANHVLGLPRVQTDAMKLGSALHMALLEPRLFEQTYVKSPDFGDLRSSKNREKKEEWVGALKAGTILLGEDEFGNLMGMIHSVMKHGDATEILKYGIPERAGYYRDPETGIQCRIKPDLFNPDVMAVVDIKSCTDCTLDSFSKTIWNFRYDFSLAMYCVGIEVITGKKVEYPLFLAVEKKPPYEVAVYRADEIMLSRGREDYARALRTILECLQANRWLGYQQKIQTIGLPAWALTYY